MPTKVRLILEVLRYITFWRLKCRTRSHLVCRSPSKHDQSIIYGDRPCVRYFRMTQSRRWSFLQIWQSIAGRYLSLRTSIMSGNTRGHEWPYLTMSESGHKAIPSHVLTYLAPSPEYSRKKYVNTMDDDDLAPYVARPSAARVMIMPP